MDKPIDIYRVFVIMNRMINYLRRKNTTTQKLYGCNNFISGMNAIEYDLDLVKSNINFCRDVLEKNMKFCGEKPIVLRSGYTIDISYMLFNMIFHLYINHYKYFILLFSILPDIFDFTDDVIETSLEIFELKYKMQGDIYGFMAEVKDVRSDQIIYTLDDIEKLLNQRMLELFNKHARR